MGVAEGVKVCVGVACFANGDSKRLRKYGGH